MMGVCEPSCLMRWLHGSLRGWAGTLQAQYTYEPFGFTSQTSAASTNSYKYTGREEDGTGLLYHRARYYRLRLQRFIPDSAVERYLG
jgi:RHS repeat-associated protein